MRVSKFVLLLTVAALCGCRDKTAENRVQYHATDDVAITEVENVSGTKEAEEVDEMLVTDFATVPGAVNGKQEAKKAMDRPVVYPSTPAPMDAAKDQMKLARSRATTASPSFAAAGEMPQIVDGSAGHGEGPGVGGDKFEHVEANPFRTVADEPLSTFSIDVDTASYSKIRSYLVNHNQLPPQGAVRVEELVNYFTYDYAAPTDQHPFAANVEAAACPWNPDHRLVRIGIKGKEIENEDRPASNLVFLLDVSGSMNNTNKLPLLKQGMKLLVDQLGENDKVAIVVYAGASGLVLGSTSGDDKSTIMEALDRLQAGGSTNGAAGIELAYQTAVENYIKGGVNRVILCTDGDFNVGVTSTSDLVTMASEKAKSGVYLSVMGFGIGNHNDAMMEELSGKANGNYAFIDTIQEAKKVLVEQMSGTLTTIAKDVKIQIEFNPNQVAAYRLVGYENRILANQDFNDDKKDAGEIGAGHCVTAFYEVVPASADTPVSTAKVDDLKYQTTREKTEAADSDELLTLKIRYKQPDEDESTLMLVGVKDSGHRFGQATGDFQFAAGVAMFGMLLRGDEQDAEVNLDEITELVSHNVGDDSYRGEFLKLVQTAKTLRK
ncbi:vWA domain-containing protein [Blastopirellula retiformator]|uniref:von Willebrand factor n=1 Tax=Blastopirellula retiformator TaxID=2527970 RepID=A0A5C5V2K7_9BACT|nr:VWA domain-containing protein [Blastopirellula retiformator]TWT32834.1 von Willebrand factor [Blastopirellula retiformator]